MSQTALKLLKIADLSGLRPEPRWGPQSAHRPLALRAANGVATCDALGLTLWGSEYTFSVTKKVDSRI